MLRINLLPPYINEARIKAQHLIAAIVIVVLVIAAFFMKYSQLTKTLSDQKALQSTAEGYRTKYDAISTEITNTQSKAQKTLDKEDFVAKAQKYDDGWATVFNEMRDLTSNDIRLKTMSLDAGTRKTISITGHANDESHIIAWWTALRNRSGVFEKVSFGLPSHPWPPVASNAGGGPGSGGMMPGSGGMMPGSGGYPGSGGMRTGGMPGSGGMRTGGMPGSGGMRTGGMPGSGGGGGGASDDIGPGVVEGRPVINFTAELVLATPLAGGIPTPIWPSTAPAASPGPAFGGGARPMGAAGPGAGGPRPRAASKTD